MVTISISLEGQNDIVLKADNVAPLRLSLDNLSKSSNVTNAMLVEIAAYTSQTLRIQLKLRFVEFCENMLTASTAEMKRQSGFQATSKIQT